MSDHSGARQRTEESEAVVDRQEKAVTRPMGGTEDSAEDKSSMQQYAQGLYFVQK
jgi:hypothetical protein